MTRYEIHFRSIARKLKQTHRMLTALDVLSNCRLSSGDKEDLYALWWHRRKKEIGLL